MRLLPKLPIDKETLRRKWFLYVLLVLFIVLLLRELRFMGTHLH